MTRIKWEGIPESCWPDTEKPWRVISGFGAFTDFATKDEALLYYKHLKETLTGDWRDSVQIPKNIVEASAA